MRGGGRGEVEGSTGVHARACAGGQHAAAAPPRLAHRPTSPTASPTHLKLAIRPLEVLASGRGLGGAQGRAVHVVRVGLVGGAVADEGGHLDERGLVGDRLGLGQGRVQALQIVVAVLDVLHVPAQRLKAGGDILGEGDLGVAVNGDAVVVVQRDQLAQAPVAGDGGGLVGDAFHVAAVAQDHVAGGGGELRGGGAGASTVSACNWVGRGAAPRPPAAPLVSHARAHAAAALTCSGPRSCRRAC